MVDRYSGWIEAIPLAIATAEKILDAFINNWICRYGLCRSIITDRGVQFTSKVFQEAMQTFGITHNLTCAYTPSSNGKIERTHRCIKSALRGGNPAEWNTRLGFALLSMRASYSETIQTCPAQVVFGSSICLPGELVDNEINDAQKPWQYGNRLQKTMAKVNFRPKVFASKPGYEDPNLRKCDYVYVRDMKRPHGLAPVYNGPYRVVRRYDKYFRLDLGNRLDSVAIHRLKTAFNPSSPQNPYNIDEEAISNADSEEWNDVYNIPPPPVQQNTQNLPARPVMPPPRTQSNMRGNQRFNIPRGTHNPQGIRRSNTINLPEAHSNNPNRGTVNWRPNR